MEHILHLAASHFAQALQIPSIMMTNQSLQELAKVFDEELHFDVNDSNDVKAEQDDSVAILDAQRTDFNAGDIVGKVLACVAQVSKVVATFNNDTIT